MSGFTFAVAGEPDFDRVIRFQNPVATRSHSPKVGVSVTSVHLNDERQPDHPLLGASVELLGEPKFESRNYVLVDGAAGPIVPFDFKVGNELLSLRRQDVLYPQAPELPIYQIPKPYLVRRGSLIPMIMDPLKVADATGILNPVGYRQKRCSLLRKELQDCSDPIARAALEKRIEELSISNPNKNQVKTLSVYNHYHFGLNGEIALHDPDGLLGLEPDGEEFWTVLFWMGGWDSDALCGYVKGVLEIPPLRNAD